MHQVTHLRKNHLMKTILLSGSCLAMLCSSGNNRVNIGVAVMAPSQITTATAASKPGSWQWFLRHLPVRQGAVVDYRGNVISHQKKAAAIIDYDIGNKDLQQCADAIIRLRAEYLFAAGRYNEIAFLFTSGQSFAFRDYCKGIRPILSRNKITFQATATPSSTTQAALRKYLDIVYTYAGTISLSKQLQPTQKLSIGTVILKPGSPGHCCIVMDEITTGSGENRYKLAESFMPAQSIYVLKNRDDGTMWHRIQPGRPLYTASYDFTTYRLYVFE